MRDRVASHKLNLRIVDSWLSWQLGNEEMPTTALGSCCGMRKGVEKQNVFLGACRNANKNTQIVYHTRVVDSLVLIVFVYHTQPWSTCFKIFVSSVAGCLACPESFGNCVYGWFKIFWAWVLVFEFFFSCSLCGCLGYVFSAPYCAISRDYLNDTLYCAPWGFGVSTWPIGAIPLFFSGRFPFGEHAKWRCDTLPTKKGISTIVARYHMKTRQMGAIPPFAIPSRKGNARCGGVWKSWAVEGASCTNVQIFIFEDVLKMLV